MNDKLKKSEKCVQEQAKQIDIKNQNLEKLRNELHSIGTLINNEKFKSIKSLEVSPKIQTDLNKCKEENSKLK